MHPIWKVYVAIISRARWRFGIYIVLIRDVDVRELPHSLILGCGVSNAAASLFQILVSAPSKNSFARHTFSANLEHQLALYRSPRCMIHY